MLHAEAYEHDDKARLHEALPELAKAMNQRTGTGDIALDSFIVSATRFDDLRKKYGDGSWDRKKFTNAHILFPERPAGNVASGGDGPRVGETRTQAYGGIDKYDYIRALIGESSGS